MAQTRIELPPDSAQVIVDQEHVVFASQATAADPVALRQIGADGIILNLGTLPASAIYSLPGTNLAGGRPGPAVDS